MVQHIYLEDAAKNPGVLSYLLRGVTAVLLCHSEQVMKPLSRHGRRLLAKRSYLTATPPSKTRHPRTPYGSYDVRVGEEVAGARIELIC